MPNPIKYTTGTETLALKKGNFYIGTGDVGKGPSDTTGYYQGPNVPSGGYVIYLNKEGVPGGLSYHSATNDSELISFTNNLANTSFTSATQCLNYYVTQTDKVCVNRDYEGIITDGLIVNVDAGFTPSYPRSGATWYDVSGSNNGTLTNGPTFSGDSIVFDGVDDFVNLGNNSNTQFPHDSPWTFSFWGKIISQNITFPGFLIKGNASSSGVLVFYFQSNEIIFKSRNINVGIPITLNTNFFYCVSNDSSGQTKIYLNGAFIINGPVMTSTDSSNNLLLGRGDQFGNVSMFNFLKYNRNLTDSEILQNYNAQKGRFGL
jgi:hypothetical protein